MSSSLTSDGTLPVGTRVAERGGARARSGSAGDRGLSFADNLTLLAIGLVVVLVSLPRLRGFAVRENEQDAIDALALLAADARVESEVLLAGGLGALLASSTRHQSRLDDVELIDGGRLRRHGYLFDAVESAPGAWVLRAWPWEHGRTGLGAFVASDAAVLGHPNAGGRFSGPASPPSGPRADAEAAPAGWRVVRRY